MTEPASGTAVPTFLKAPAAFARMTEAQAGEAFAYTLGVQAVLWGLQWVKAAEALRMFSAPLPSGKERSPYDPQPHAVNVWGHARRLLNAATRLIETPNTETLYSIIVVDLSDGPVVVEHPDFGERYFRSSIWDIHSDTHTISQKQDGSQPPPYALVPVGWHGSLPDGMKAYEIRSRYLQIAPHVAVYGDDDLPDVHALQDQLKVIALADWGKSGAPLEPGAPIPSLRRLDARTSEGLMFFEELGEVLKLMTIRDDEVGFARQLEAIGITLDDGFQIDRLDVPAVAGLERAVLDATTLAAHRARTVFPIQPGGTWAVGGDVTSLDDWLGRAGVGYGYVWGDLATEILFPMARTDENGEPLTGKQRYTLTFPKGESPPARYWRISMYDTEGFFVDNPIDRYGIGNMAEEPEIAADGSLTVLLQHESPGPGKGTNWLPTPKDGFFLALRLYQPEYRMYRGEYTIPPVRNAPAE
jgi:hypothetical protein